MQRLFLRFAAVIIITLAAAPTATSQATHVDREGFPLPSEAIARIGSVRLRHLGVIHGVAYSRDGKQIISIGADDRSCVWDAATGKLLRSCDAKLGTRFPMAVRIADTTVDVATNDFLFSFDAHAGKLVRKVGVSFLRFAQQAWFSPDGAWLAYGSSVLDVRAAAEGKANASRALGTYPASECCGFTADGKRVVVFCNAPPKPYIEFIDPATGKGERRTELPAMTRCWFAADGRCLIGASIWDPKAGKRLAALPADKERMTFGSVAFSPDSRHLAIPNWRDVGLYDTATGKELRRLPAGPDAAFRPYVPTVGAVRRAMAFAPDGTRLVVGNHEGQLSQWDVATGKLLCSAEPATGYLRVRRFIDRDRLAAERGDLVVYSRPTGALLHRYRFPWQETAPLPFEWRTSAEGVIYVPPHAAQLSPDGTTLALPRKDARIELRDAETGKEIRMLAGTPPGTAVLAFAPNGKRLYSSGGALPDIRVWDVANGKLLRTIAGVSGQFSGSHHKRADEYIAIGPDSRLFATAANSPTVAPGSKWPYWLRVWDAGSFELAYRQGFPLPLSRHCTFSATGELLVVLDGVEDRKADVLSLIDPTTGAVRWSIHPNAPLEVKQTRVTSVAFSADGQHLAVGGDDGTLVLYEAATGRRRHAYRGLVRAVDGLAFTPDGDQLAASSADAAVLLWDVYGNHDGKGSLPSWNAAQAADLWKELAGADGERAFQTVRRLVHRPQAAVALLRAHLLPRVQEQGKRFAKLLRALDSDDFEVRQQAQTEIKQRADEFELFLSRTRVRDYPLEVQRRLEPIIAKLDPANPERLRRLRSMEALRQIATPEARQLLESLAASGAAPGRKP